MKKLLILAVLVCMGLLIADPIPIGEGTLTTTHIPMDPYWGYTYSQVIYTAAEIGGAVDIENVSWHYNGNSAYTEESCTIYMGHTTLDEFGAFPSWIPVTELTEVWTGPFTMMDFDHWLTVELDNMFAYNGTDNLVIAFDANTVGCGSYGDSFIGTGTTVNRSIYYYSDGTNPDPANPPTSRGTENYSALEAQELNKTVMRASGVQAVIANIIINNDAVLPSGVVNGNVYAAQEVPIEGAEVTVNGFMGTTDAMGFYEIEVMTEGTFPITVSAYGYFSGVDEVTVVFGGIQTVDFNLDVFDPAGTNCADPYVLETLPYTQTGMSTELYGNDYTTTDACANYYMGGNDLVYAYTPEVNSSINIALTNTSTYTGLYVVEGFVDDPNAVCIDMATGNNPFLQEVPLPMGITYYIVVATSSYYLNTTFDIAIEVTAFGNLDGTVTNVNEAAIEGAIVSAGGISDTTNTEGYYSFADMITGEYNVTVTANGYYSGSEMGVFVVDGQTTTVNFALEVFDNIGDTIEDPIVIGAFPYFMSGDLSLYTDYSTGAGLDGSRVGADIYFQIDVTVPANLELHCCGTEFDTYMHLYDSAYTRLAYDDDGCSDWETGLGSASWIGDGTPTFVPAGTYYVAVEAYSAYTTPGYFEVHLAELDPPVYGTIAGTILNSVTELPVVDVSVAIGSYTLLTDDMGYYSLDQEVGTYSVTADIATYFPQTVTGVAVVAGETTVVDFDLVERTLGTLAGTVLDGGTDLPVVGAEVVAGVLTQITNEIGYYIFDDIEIGIYNIAVSADGYFNESAAGVEVVVGETTIQNFTLEMFNDIGDTILDPIVIDAFPYSMSGDITLYTDYSTGAALPSTKPGKDVFWMFELESAALMDFNSCGSEFDTYMHLYDSEYAQIAYDDDGCSSWGSGIYSASWIGDGNGIIVPPGTYYICNEAYFSSTPTNPYFEVHFNTFVTGFIVGTVTDFDTDLAIAGATVTSGGITATTDAAGYYSLELLPETYDVNYSATGYNPWTEVGVEVVADQNVMVDVALEPISGVVFEMTVDTWSSEASWNLWDVAAGAFYWATDLTFSAANETQTISVDLPDGDYEVYCYDSYGDGGIAGVVSKSGVIFTQWASGDYEGDPGYEGIFPFTAVPIFFGGLEGTVTDAFSGLPLASATISVGTYLIATDAMGYYSIPQLLIGDYDVYCYRASYVGDMAPVTIIEGETTVQDFVLDLALESPTEFVATADEYNVDLEWVSPFDPPADLLRWDSMVNDNAIGIGAGTFIVAARFTQTELAEYDGEFLTDVTIYINDLPTEMIVYVWSGANAANILLEQTVIPTAESWNTFVYNTSVMIDASEELWIGYEVTQVADMFPAGCDAGPGVVGFGDMISQDGGVTWDALSLLAPTLSANWNIWGGIEMEQGERTTIARPQPWHPEPIVATSRNELSAAGIGETVRDFTGSYNVYRDGGVIATVTESMYSDLALPEGTYEYYVTAIHVEGESPETDHIIIDVYPVDITGFVTLSDTPDTTPLVGAAVIMENDMFFWETVTDANGEFLFENITGNNTYTMSVIYEDYQNWNEEVVVEGEDMNFPLISVMEMIYPPSGLLAEVNEENTACGLIWSFQDSWPVYEISYVDDVAENATAWYDPGNERSVWFTAQGGPCLVTGGSMNIYTGAWPAGNALTPFTACVWAYDGVTGLPGELLGSVEVTPTDYNWVSFTFDTPISVDGTEFFLGYQQGGTYPDCAPMAVDETSPDGRSYERVVTSGTPWEISEYQDFMLRAVVQGPTGREFTLSHDNPVVDLGNVMSNEGSVTEHAYIMPQGEMTVGNASYIPVHNSNPFAMASSRETRLDREQEGYNVFVGEWGDEANYEMWNPVNTAVIIDTFYTDMGWADYMDGHVYTYAVRSVYTNDNMSGPTFSNSVGKNMYATLDVTLTNDDGDYLDGAEVTINATAPDPAGNYPSYMATTDMLGECTFTDVWKGNYDLTASMENYTTLEANINVLETIETYAGMLEEIHYQPAELAIDVDGMLTWGLQGIVNYEVLNEEGFETWPPEGWTFSDADGDTYGWESGVSGFTPYEGVGCAYSASYDNINYVPLTPDNWLITPAITMIVDGNVNYFVSAQDAAWAGEHYGVYVSTTGTDPADFTLLFEETMTARNAGRVERLTPKGSRDQGAWYERNVAIEGYTGDIYLAFRHFNSTDWFYLDLDAVTVSQGVMPSRSIEGYNIYIDGLISGTTTDSYYDLTSIPGLMMDEEYTVGVSTYYTSGYESPIAELVFNCTWETIVYGDVTGDEIVDAFDAANVLQFTVGMDPVGAALPWTWELVAGDVDGNGDPEAYDAALILQYAVGMITVFPVEVRSDVVKADVTMSSENGELVFTTAGDLYGFSVMTESELITFGEPVVEYLAAANGNAVALANADAIEGDFLRIPYELNAEMGEIVFTMTSNGISSEHTYNVEDLESAPVVNAVLGNYPNPFNPSTEINYAVKAEASVMIAIYNVKGQLVKSLVNEVVGMGTHSVEWSGSDNNNRPVSSGVYFYMVQIGSDNFTNKMIMLK